MQHSCILLVIILIYTSVSETYSSRTKRDLPRFIDGEIMDVGQVETKLVTELGTNVCIYERICEIYAEITLNKRSRQHELDWDAVFR